MTMEARMTVCNMSIEAGARAGMVAPDDTTFAYMVEAGRMRRKGAAMGGGARDVARAASRTPAPRSTGKSRSTARRSRRW